MLHCALGLWRVKGGIGRVEVGAGTTDEAKKNYLLHNFCWLERLHNYIKNYDNYMNTEDNDFPLIIESKYEMDQPNQEIEIDSGDFYLMFGEHWMKVNGKVYFKWFPEIGPHFTGNVIELHQDLDYSTIMEGECELKIDDNILGKVFITKSISSSGLFGALVEGVFLREAVVGDKSIPVTKINFVVPNLRDFFGLPVLKENRSLRNRLAFENDDYTINLDKSPYFKDNKDKLVREGGYVTLYSGEITTKKRDIKFNELSDLIDCFSRFLSFINGRKTTMLFVQGMHEDETIWTDYSGRLVDLYKNVHSWPSKFSIDGLTEIWRNFYNMWKDRDDRDFLNSSVHWYLEANSNSGAVDGSIIMAQTCLELIYNWYIIEKKKLLLGKDGESISASNKLRLLISQLHISPSEVGQLNRLKAFARDEKIDGIEAFVQIRNAIVHSQVEKRKKLLDIHVMVRYESLQLGLWYIEISLLFILKFKGKYDNRVCDKPWIGECEEMVPF